MKVATNEQRLHTKNSNDSTLSSSAGVPPSAAASARTLRSESYAHPLSIRSWRPNANSAAIAKITKDCRQKAGCSSAWRSPAHAGRMPPTNMRTYASACTGVIHGSLLSAATTDEPSRTETLATRTSGSSTVDGAPSKAFAEVGEEGHRAAEHREPELRASTAPT